MDTALQNRNFKEYECILRARPSSRKSQLVGSDQWWTIEQHTDIAELWAELEMAVREQVLPWLAQVSTWEDTIQQAIEFYEMGCVSFYTVARLLIDCGYGKELLPVICECNKGEKLMDKAINALSISFSFEIF